MTADMSVKLKRLSGVVPCSYWQLLGWPPRIGQRTLCMCHRCRWQHSHPLDIEPDNRPSSNTAVGEPLRTVCSQLTGSAAPGSASFYNRAGQLTRAQYKARSWQAISMQAAVNSILTHEAIQDICLDLSRARQNSPGHTLTPSF